jgi:hypothetical protein
MTKRRKVLNVERLNTEFERRKIFHTIYERFLSSVVIPQVGSCDSQTEGWTSCLVAKDAEIRVGKQP